MRFAPVTVWRRGTTPYRRLAELTPLRTWEALEAARRVREERGPAAEELLDELHQLVPRAPRPLRRDLLRLRRDLFNERLPDPRVVASCGPALSVENRAELSRWIGAREREETFLAQAEDRLRIESARMREALAELAGDTDFGRGLQLFDRVFSPQARRLPEIAGKRARSIESTLISLAYRSSLKPSPYASFTEVGIASFDGEHGEGARRRSALVNRRRVRQVTTSLLTSDTAPDDLVVRLNNTARRLDDRVEFFVTGEGGKEFFRALPATAEVTAVSTALEGGPMTRSALLEKVAAAGHDPGRVGALLSALVRHGYCECGLDILDQVVHYPGTALRRLRRAGAATGPLAAFLSGLDHAERALPTASIEERERLLGLVEDRFRTGREAAGTSGRDGEGSLIFEDLLTTGRGRSWRPETVREQAPAFEAIHRLLPLFDDAVLGRLALLRCFEEWYGDTGRCEDVLDFYRRFAALDPARSAALLLGDADDRVATVLRLRRSFFTRLAGALGSAQDELALPASEIAEFTAAFPPFLGPWEAAAHQIQFLDGEEPARLVLNGVASGYAAFWSRFAGLPDGEEAPAVRAAREFYAALGPRNADLVAVLGHNVNVHPRLVPWQIEYPGSAADRSAGKVLTLRDLAVEADAAACRLRLVCRTDGRPIEPTPQNMMHPSVAPSLYRVLLMFVRSAHVHGGLWRLYRAFLARNGTEPANGPVSLPRLRVGGIVLERRAWTFPKAMLPPAGDTNEVTVALLATMNDWRREHGLPAECFYRLEHGRRGLGRVLASDGAKAYKPHYLDFRHPHLLVTLTRHVRLPTAEHVTIQECLPSTGHYSPGSALESAEEHVVEAYGPALAQPARP